MVSKQFFRSMFASITRLHISSLVEEIYIASHCTFNMCEKMDRMTELVEQNLARSQMEQKQWYDKNARTREFKRDLVLVLLPTSSSKLLAQWQGPY